MLNTLRLDPSRTTMLRRRFIGQMNARFRVVRDEVVRFVGDADVFGLAPREGMTQVQALATYETRQYEFLTSPQKLETFKRWLQEQIDLGLLTVDPMTSEPWTAKYVYSAYRQGVIRSWRETKKKKGVRTDPFEDLPFLLGDQEQFFKAVFAQPVVLDKVKALYTRSFEQLRGVTNTMAQQMNRILADAMAHGRGPLETAKEMSKAIDGLTKNRARMIARTEIIHAHAEGQLDSFEALGVGKIEAVVEWTTAGDERVCPICLDLEGNTYTISEARGLIPAHPNCVLGESTIIANDCTSAFKADFTGKIVEIFLASGRSLSITENHILLTEYGFVPAKFLYNGINLLDTKSINGTGIICPYNDGNVSSISDVFASFEKSPFMFSMLMPTSSKYLHGDGKFVDSEINIIRPNSELRCQGQSIFSSYRVETKFPPAQSGNIVRFLPTLSSAAKLLKGVFFSFDSSMGIFRDPLSLLLGCVLHSKVHGFASIPWGDIVVRKSSGDYSSTDPILFSKCLDTHPILKQFNNLMDGNFGSEFFRVYSGYRDSSHLKSFFECGTSGFASLCDRVNAFPGFVSSDRILHINVKHVVSAPVYDVSTLSSLYNLNGVLSSNCRCAWAIAG